jgi:hypothetical protein
MKGTVEPTGAPSAEPEEEQAAGGQTEEDIYGDEPPIEGATYEPPQAGTEEGEAGTEETVPGEELPAEELPEEELPEEEIPAEELPEEEIPVEELPEEETPGAAGTEEPQAPAAGAPPTQNQPSKPDDKGGPVPDWLKGSK